MKRSYLSLLGAVITGGILLALTIWLTSPKEATNRENGLLQFIFLAIGVASSYYFGRQSVSEAARDVLRPHGRKSVRRIVNLGQGITSVGSVMSEQRKLLAIQAEENSGQVSFAQVEHTFATMDVVLTGQLRTAEDAIEDWRDVLPDEVKALEGDPERDGVQ